MVITWASLHPASIALTHLPTGLTEHTLAHRSQHLNRDACVARLKSKLAMGATHPLPMRASYELPDGHENPNWLDEYREEQPNE